ncbi:hypothetical protein HanIR_Chr13g0646931 [Helianthus annuus]|nr:hypothetical protein HanIR_Chr13g0646931 [Helianthus annuus]
MEFEYLEGVQFLEVLAFCFRCAMKIPVQSRHALIFRGVTQKRVAVELVARLPAISL